jgi:CxxC-x17-CxxC domain-containing protein
MVFEDKTIVCSDCGQEFVHSADDQKRYSERGFTNEPKRCRECREKRKAKEGGGGGGGGMGGGGGRGGMSRGGGGDRGGRPPRSGSGGGGSRSGPRESFEVVCAECGQTTTVPFKPAGDRPVYCRDCFRSKRR